MHGWTSRQRNAAIASFLSWTLDAFDLFLLVFLLSDIAHLFHVDLEEVTLAILLTLAVRPVGALIFGRAAEKFGRKPILMLNIVFFSAFELLSAAAPSLMLFFLLRVLYGVAMGGIWGVASSLAMETIPDRSRGLMSGLFQAGYPFGYLLAAVAYGLLFEQLGWRGMFLIGALPIVLLPYIWFKVPESPVWLAARERKESTALLPILRSHWKLCIYLVLLMACFNFFSHGTQDLYPTFLKVQHSFDPHTVSLIAISYNIAAMLGGILFGSLSERIGRKKAMIIAAFLALPVLPLWAFSTGSFNIGLGAFLMQFMVQGAWGVVPTYLNELVPANARAVLPGFVYQLGNLLASVNATLQARIAEANGGNYGLAMALVAGTVAILICLFVAFGRETRGVIISGQQPHGEPSRQTR
ncbi:MAG: MFS transporter [Pluralibacter gergoviae]|nr:MFS transporter [Pluralibacter gergoviae]